MHNRKLLISVNLDESQPDSSATGLENTLNVFDKFNVRGTFFITINWAQLHSGLVQRLSARHEIGLYAHEGSNMDHIQLKGLKDTLQGLSGTLVYGFRNAGTLAADAVAVKAAGFIYQAPAIAAGRHKPRTLFQEKDLWTIPVSVSPLFRYAFSAHNVKHTPGVIIQHLCNTILRKDGMITITYPLTADNRSSSLLQVLQNKGQFYTNIEWLQEQLYDGN
ncbi:hypothetical protein SAMN05518672_110172 [Chitinophaga sp. CF118]|uniref:hypothetical protein n=1 Tax=Chitinophaga sp. CF118 TaxID=1884367 RepID=UPI0008F1DD4A|nr:hypothetical protein [Chitinophaga sp. CF118]SFE81227.1 hypothetical protein SAMN05518672_110172 [Chitinophaga sp. CF118]